MKNEDTILDTRAVVASGNITDETIIKTAEEFFDACYWQAWDEWDTFHCYLFRPSGGPTRIVASSQSDFNTGNDRQHLLRMIDWYEIYQDNVDNSDIRDKLQITTEFNNELL